MVLLVYSLTKKFPQEEVYTLTSQFRRSAISTPANIAEGYKRKGKLDKLKFLNIAQGSLEESRYYGILSRDLEYINVEQFEKLNDCINEVSYLLNSYVSSISKSAKSNSSISL